MTLNSHHRDLQRQLEELQGLLDAPELNEGALGVLLRRVRGVLQAMAPHQQRWMDHSMRYSIDHDVCQSLLETLELRLAHPSPLAIRQAGADFVRHQRDLILVEELLLDGEAGSSAPPQAA